MAYCGKCGAQVGEQAAFCPMCGQQQGVVANGSAAPQRAQSGLSEHVAGMLCYLLGWLTGLIFLLIDKRPFVRFHAAQSLVVFGALHIVSSILGFYLGVGFLRGGGMHWQNWASVGFVFHLLHIGELILWILLMIKAFQGEKFRIPIASEVADGIAGR